MSTEEARDSHSRIRLFVRRHSNRPSAKSVPNERSHGAPLSLLPSFFVAGPKRAVHVSRYRLQEGVPHFVSGVHACLNGEIINSPLAPCSLWLLNHPLCPRQGCFCHTAQNTGYKTRIHPRPLAL